MSLFISPEQMDRAIAERKVRVSFRPADASKRPCRCVVSSCRAAVLPGTGRPVWIDGHRRGYLCPPCVGAVRLNFSGGSVYGR